MVTREKFKVYKNVFDERTLRILFKLESEGYIEDLRSPISIGKESNIFSAVNKSGDHLIIKIYRVNNADFKKMYRYVSADTRFEGLSNQRRKVIQAWAQREYRNLLVSREAGARVPLPYVVKENVLVMELIGDHENAAPRLKDKAPKDLKEYYKDLMKNIKILYKAGFVHGDLSEFNILNHNEKAYLIDLSHGTKLDTDLAFELLERDLNNVVRFFNKKGLKLNVEDLLKEIKS